MNTKSLGSFLRITFALILSLGSLTLLHSPTVNAASTLTVTKVADTDDGICNADCSLREAITAAASGDTTVFASGLAGQTITLGSQLDIAKDLTIDGSSLSTHVKISGNKAVRVFSINSGVNVTLTHLDIINGYTASDGGGIYNSGTLTLQNSTISDNSVTWYGGGIYNSGTLIVQNSTISGNSAKDGYGHGGSIYNTDYIGGNIVTAGMLTVTNSTLSGNSAEYDGGGIWTFGTLTVQNSTLFNNSAKDVGGGIYNGYVLSVINSTISGNSAQNEGGGILNGYNAKVSVD